MAFCRGWPHRQVMLQCAETISAGSYDEDYSVYHSEYFELFRSSWGQTRESHLWGEHNLIDCYKASADLLLANAVAEIFRGTFSNQISPINKGAANSVATYDHKRLSLASYGDSLHAYPASLAPGTSPAAAGSTPTTPTTAPPSTSTTATSASSSRTSPTPAPPSASWRRCRAWRGRGFGGWSGAAWSRSRTTGRDMLCIAGQHFRT